MPPMLGEPAHAACHRDATSSRGSGALLDRLRPQARPRAQGRARARKGAQGRARARKDVAVGQGQAERA
jgi:hypothetical protein